MLRHPRTRTGPALVGLLCLLGCVSCQRFSANLPAPDEDMDLGPVPHFALTDRDGRTVTDRDLLGKVWLASFVFTRCMGPCPQVAATLTQLQSELADRPDVRLVTFTVDPEHDSPRELDEYAARFRADPKRWLFLTGKEDELLKLVNKGFHIFAQPNTGAQRQPGREVQHDTRLALVDRRGHIRGYYEGLRDPRWDDPEAEFQKNLGRLRQKVDALLREAP
jgi:cytochrome oxidase Cu insertion factor (SCO1/SenC/PrrC family)